MVLKDHGLEIETDPLKKSFKKNTHTQTFIIKRRKVQANPTSKPLLGRLFGLETFLFALRRLRAARAEGAEGGGKLSMRVSSSEWIFWGGFLGVGR